MIAELIIKVSIVVMIIWIFNDMAYGMDNLWKSKK